MTNTQTTERQWVELTDAEVDEVIAYLRSQRIFYAGCVNSELIRRYGADNIRHQTGVGWFRAV